MATEFHFENVFRAPDVRTVLSAYFDTDHIATQDRVAQLVDREVLERHDDGSTLQMAWRVAAAEKLPLFARPFVDGGRLSYVERMTWRRADDAIDLVVTPQLLGGRVSIEAVYELAQAGERQVRRRYRGAIHVNVKLVSGRVEKAILRKFEESMPQMAACTQDWLDRTVNG